MSDYTHKDTQNLFSIKNNFIAFTIANIVRLVKTYIYLITLEVITKKYILVDVRNILHILLTEIAWAFLTKPL